jgi:ferredoxin--NADP+ reductase
VSNVLEVVGEPKLPEVKMHLIPPTAPAEGTVLSNELCLKGRSASFVRHVCIDIGNTPMAGQFRAGQSFGVVPSGVDATGKPHKVRLYSIASPSWGEDGHGKVLATTPKRLISERSPQKAGDDPHDHSLFLGLCSNYVCDLKPGDPLAVTGPAGKRFLLPEDPAKHDYLFLATGTGIAPFRGMIMELLQGPPEGSPWRANWKRCESRIELVMGSPYTTDLLYDGLFRDLAAKHSNFHYHPVISRETRTDGGKGEYAHQFIERRLGDRYDAMLRSPRTLIYVCGLAGMQMGLFRILGEKGLANGYLTVDESIAGVPASEWTDEHLKRKVRPTHRCMIEVY